MTATPRTIDTTARGCLPAGTVTEFGVIERRSLTAYLIAGAWVSFDAVHGKPAMAEALVTLGGAR